MQEKTKKRISARVSLEAYAVYQGVIDAQKLTKTEALEQILRAFLSPQNSSEGEPSPSGASDPLAPELKCKRRILIDGDYLCVNKPPKAVELVSIEVCNVCKSLGIGLRDSTKIDIPKEETFDRPREPIRQPNKELEKVGMIWCPQDAIMAFPEKCAKCRQQNSAIWLHCQKQKYKEKGEQLRQ